MPEIDPLPVFSNLCSEPLFYLGGLLGSYPKVPFLNGDDLS